jgi:hypothetical protein
MTNPRRKNKETKKKKKKVEKKQVKVIDTEIEIKSSVNKTKKT